jgi:DNA-binding HxlR family transcriptional regulator
MERQVGATAEDDQGAGEGSSYREGIYRALALLHGEWVVAVLASLATGPLKYGELRQEINDAEARAGWTLHAHPVSQKVLSATLLRMRRDGLIVRTSRSGTSFNPVWYELTPLGRTFLRSLRPLAKWAQDNDAAVGLARARYAEDEGAPDEP